MRRIIMRIYCISDLHLGNRGEADDFTGEVYLKHFLNLVGENDLLVLNGDILELRQFSLEEIIDAYEDLLSRLFLNRKVVYVVGNHDIEMLGREFYGVKVVSEFMIGNMIFIHGHQFDWLNNKHRWMVDWALRFLRWLEEKIDPNIETKLEKLLKYGRWADTDKKYKKMAFEFGRRFGKNKVILGHTHRKGVWFSKDVIYYNCGCWVNGKEDFLTLYKPPEVGGRNVD